MFLEVITVSIQQRAKSIEKEALERYGFGVLPYSQLLALCSLLEFLAVSVHHESRNAKAQNSKG